MTDVVYVYKANSKLWKSAYGVCITQKLLRGRFSQSTTRSEKLHIIQVKCGILFRG
jgi:hypothetical protein